MSVMDHMALVMFFFKRRVLSHFSVHITSHIAVDLPWFSILDEVLSLDEVHSTPVVLLKLFPSAVTPLKTWHRASVVSSSMLVLTL